MLLITFSYSEKIKKKHSHHQNGVALVMVLVFLVILTGASVWGVRQSLLSEGMARNQLDQEVARDAAESALRDAERDVFFPSMTTATNASCSRGVVDLSKVAFTAGGFKSEVQHPWIQ